MLRRFAEVFAKEVRDVRDIIEVRREKRNTELMQVWRVIAILFALHLSPFTALAQDEPEYRLEIGGGVGLLGYLGDFNGSLTQDLQPAVSVVARYKSNPRWVWTVNLTTGKLKGGSEGEETWYPDPQSLESDTDRMPPYHFSNQLMDLGLRYEYNFWPYGTGREYYGARRLVPFIALGLGITFVSADKSVFAGNLPIGAGVKYKIGNRLNLVAEWTMHFTGSDGLDGVSDPYGIKSSGLFKNTDCYSQLRVSVTYDLWAKCKTCHNDR